MGQIKSETAFTSEEASGGVSAFFFLACSLSSLFFNCMVFIVFVFLAMATLLAASAPATYAPGKFQNYLDGDERTERFTRIPTPFPPALFAEWIPTTTNPMANWMRPSISNLFADTTYPVPSPQIVVAAITTTTTPPPPPPLPLVHRRREPVHVVVASHSKDQQTASTDPLTSQKHVRRKARVRMTSSKDVKSTLAIIPSLATTLPSVTEEMEDKGARKAGSRSQTEPVAAAMQQALDRPPTAKDETTLTTEEHVMAGFTSPPISPPPSPQLSSSTLPTTSFPIHSSLSQDPSTTSSYQSVGSQRETYQDTSSAPTSRPLPTIPNASASYPPYRPDTDATQQEQRAMRRIDSAPSTTSLIMNPPPVTRSINGPRLADYRRSRTNSVGGSTRLSIKDHVLATRGAVSALPRVSAAPSPMSHSMVTAKSAAGENRHSKKDGVRGSFKKAAPSINAFSVDQHRPVKPTATFGYVSDCEHACARSLTQCQNAMNDNNLYKMAFFYLKARHHWKVEVYKSIALSLIPVAGWIGMIPSIRSAQKYRQFKQKLEEILVDRLGSGRFAILKRIHFDRKVATKLQEFFEQESMAPVERMECRAWLDDKRGQWLHSRSTCKSFRRFFCPFWKAGA